VHEPARCAVGIHCHPANGIYGELAHGRLPFSDRGEQLDRLVNVAQGCAATRLVEHALELGYERSGLRRQQDLAATRYP
jgi:hypothetical protein